MSEDATGRCKEPGIYTAAPYQQEEAKGLTVLWASFAHPPAVK